MTNSDPISGKVLIADDIEQNVELLLAHMEGMGCETITAYDGQETLDKARAEKPALILLDIMMPKISGYEVCKQLKSDPETEDIMILMVTALNENSDMERGVEAGTDDFLSKPINKLELQTRVRSLLRFRNVKDELERTLAYYRDLERP